MKTIFFSSHDVSKPDSGSYLSEVQLYSVDAIPGMSYVICLKNSDMSPVTIRQQYFVTPKNFFIDWDSTLGLIYGLL